MPFKKQLVFAQVGVIIVLISCLLCASASLAFSQKAINALHSLANSGVDATPAVRDALLDARKMGKKKLSFAKGRYDFYPDRASERYLFTSNNDEGLKRIVFDLSSFSNFEIDGQGASFIFHGFVSPFIIEKASHITIRNLTIDWQRTLSSEATIVNVDSLGMVLQISKEYPYDIRNGQLRFKDDTGVEYPYGSLLEFDAQKNETAYMAEDYYLEGNIPAVEIKPGLVKLLKPGMCGKKGNIMVFNAAKRLCSAFTIEDSHDLLFDSVTIYHAGGMGIVAQKSSNITVDHYTVTRNPNTGRALSITADATHFVNCSGTIMLQNSLFEHQMDDATNIHGVYVQITQKLGPNRIEVMLKHGQQMGFDFIKPNQQLELVHPTTMEAYDTMTVKSVNRINKQVTQVEFTKPLPGALVVRADVLASIHDNPNVVLRNSRIQKNRARGILIGSRGKVVIDNNYFHTSGAAILFEGDGSYWFEQAGVRNVVVSNNVFDNCNYGVWGNAVIQIGSGVQEQFRDSSRYNQNITIRNNTFNVFDPRIIHAYSVDRLKFVNNVINTSSAYVNRFPDGKAFNIAHCSNVTIETISTSKTSPIK